MSLFIYLCQSPARATVRYIFPDVSYWTGFTYIVGLTFVSVALDRTDEQTENTTKINRIQIIRKGQIRHERK